MPMVKRGCTPCSSRPPAAATTNEVAASGRTARPPWTGLSPRTVCSQIEVYGSTPKAAMLKASAPAITPVNAEVRNSDRSSSGCATRSSTTTKQTRASAAIPNVASVCPDAQPTLPARTTAYVAAPANTAKAAVPAQSVRRSRAPCDSGTVLPVSQMAATLTGRLTKKIHRQPGPSVSSPPTTGPIAAAPPATAPQSPSATDRSLPW